MHARFATSASTLRSVAILPALAAIGAIAAGCAADASAPGTVEAERVGVAEQRWEIQSPSDETKATHLFIVNRALDLLAAPEAQLSPQMRALRSAMVQDPECNAKWRQGLFDADYKATFTDGARDITPESSLTEIAASGATWESHFYDPHTELNYKGRPKTARTQSQAMLDATYQRWTTDRPLACYSLGVALHYFTDITQPMHTAQFTNLSLPLKLHGNVEGHAQDIQATQKYPMVSRSYGSATPDQFLTFYSKISKARWKEEYDAIGRTYASRQGLLKCVWAVTVHDDADCWTHGEADALILRDLDDARKWTADYLYAVAQKLPKG